MSPPMDSEAVAQDTPSNGQAVAAAPPTAAPKTGTDKVDRAELKQNLDPIEYYVTQEKGTEKPFTNKFYELFDDGVYHCLICKEQLFQSETKYHSGSGWPSFFDVVDKNKVKLTADSSGVGGNLLRIVKNPELIRTEVSCKKCGAHLGHVFKDGPKPTGQRYCVNSSSLAFCPSASSSDATDGKEGEEKKKKAAPLEHLATIDGCGADGLCTLKGRQEAMKKQKEMEKARLKEAAAAAAAAEEEAKTNNAP